jgi:PAS domain S-box-containing protein
MKKKLDTVQLKPFISEVFWEAPSLMSIIDLEDGTLVEANKAYLKFYGYERKEVIGRKFTTLRHLSPEGINNFFQQIKEKGSTENILLKVKDKNNQDRQLLASVKKVKINNKTLFFVVGTDISRTVLTSQKVQDDIIKIYDSCRDEGVLLISNYEKKNPSLFYANDVAKIILKKYSFEKLINKLKGQESTKLNVGSRSYYVKKKGTLDVSALQIIMIYPLPNSLYIKKTLKKYNLTPKKQEVALMASSGDSNRDIAKKLSISEYTVKEYLKEIFRIIGIHHRSELFPKLVNIINSMVILCLDIC